MYGGAGRAFLVVVNPAANNEVDAFIDRWRGVAVLPGSTELATAQSFVLDLCRLLDVPPPHHADDYQFERPITFTHGDGSSSPGRIDCYKRGAFVLEAKKLKPGSAAAVPARRVASGHISVRYSFPAH